MIAVRGLFARTRADAKRVGVTLRAVDFAWEKGILAIMGTPRDGVQALLEILAGDLLPAQGSARVLVHAPGAVRRHVAYVPRDVRLPEALRVRELCDLAGDLRGEPRVPAATRLAPLRLERLAERWTTSLSVTEARAVALCLAIASSARVLLIDEPLVEIESGAASLVSDALRTRGEAGACVVVTTSSVRDATRLGDQLAILTAGVFAFVPPSYAHAGADGARLRVVLGEVGDERLTALTEALTGHPAITTVERASFAGGGAGLVVSGHDLLTLADATNRTLAEQAAPVAVLELAVMPLDGIRFTLASPRAASRTFAPASPPSAPPSSTRAPTGETS